MNIIIFTHPAFFKSRSMQRFASVIEAGMRERGHSVTTWTAKSYFSRLSDDRRIAKWMGYIDQLVIFPLIVRWRLKKISRQTLLVFCDQALGAWVPLAKDFPTIIHCNDFIALKSSLGEFPDNTSSFTGKVYQWYIRRGFNSGRRFISISEKTQADLARFLEKPPLDSTVVYLGPNYPFQRLPKEEAEALLASHSIESGTRFIMHVGGNQWYKNRKGVIALYSAYARRVAHPLPLLMFGEQPPDALKEMAARLPPGAELRFIVNPETAAICAAYSVADALIFPSLTEGFGWPILEAMACGCAVLCNGSAPMTEVGGDVASYIPPVANESIENWSDRASLILVNMLSRSDEEKRDVRNRGIDRSHRFDSDLVLDHYERLYQQAIGQD